MNDVRGTSEFGQGSVHNRVINGKRREVGIGDSVTIRTGEKHGIKAVGGSLHIIEVQIGDELVEEDIERYYFDWEE